MKNKLLSIFFCIFIFGFLFSMVVQAQTSSSTDENGIFYDILVAGAAGGIIAGGYSLKNFIKNKTAKKQSSTAFSYSDDKIQAYIQRYNAAFLILKDYNSGEFRNVSLESNQMLVGYILDIIPLCLGWCVFHGNKDKKQKLFTEASRFLNNITESAPEEMADEAEKFKASNAVYNVYYSMMLEYKKENIDPSYLQDSSKENYNKLIADFLKYICKIYPKIEWYDGIVEDFKHCMDTDEADENNKNNNSLVSEEQYQFENQNEFLIYTSISNSSNITWLSNDEYFKLYKEGFQLFEHGEYTQAIDKYKKCLALNPIGISARFELVECYIITKQYALAKEALFFMKDYFYDNSQTAKFYRRLGFILIEEGLYEIAYACFLCSLKFEKHDIAKNELKFINVKYGITMNNIHAEKILDNYIESYNNKTQKPTKNRNKKKIVAIIIAVVVLVGAGIGGGIGIYSYSKNSENREAVAKIEEAMIYDVKLMIISCDQYLNMQIDYDEFKSHYSYRVDAFLKEYDKINNPAKYKRKMYQYVLNLSTAINDNDLNDILEARNDLAEHIDY